MLPQLVIEGETANPVYTNYADIGSGLQYNTIIAFSGDITPASLKVTIGSMTETFNPQGGQDLFVSTSQALYDYLKANEGRSLNMEIRP